MRLASAVRRVAEKRCNGPHGQGRRLGAPLLVVALLGITAAAPAAADTATDRSPRAGRAAVSIETAGGLLPQAIPCLRSILERSMYGATEHEAAAWLVASPSPGGELSCLAWPRSPGKGEARWIGPVPAGVVAQVHSHPVRSGTGQAWTRRPSRTDCEVARQLGIPVLAVTAGGVYECQPRGGAIVRLLRGGWDRNPPATVVARAAETPVRTRFTAPAATLPR